MNGTRTTHFIAPIFVYVAACITFLHGYLPPFYFARRWSKPISYFVLAMAYSRKYGQIHRYCVKMLSVRPISHLINAQSIACKHQYRRWLHYYWGIYAQVVESMSRWHVYAFIRCNKDWKMMKIEFREKMKKTKKTKKACEDFVSLAGDVSPCARNHFCTMFQLRWETARQRWDRRFSGKNAFHCKVSYWCTSWSVLLPHNHHTHSDSAD